MSEAIATIGRRKGPTIMGTPPDFSKRIPQLDGLAA